MVIFVRSLTSRPIASRILIRKTATVAQPSAKIAEEMAISGGAVRPMGHARPAARRAALALIAVDGLQAGPIDAIAAHAVNLVGANARPAWPDILPGPAATGIGAVTFAETSAPRVAV